MYLVTTWFGTYLHDGKKIIETHTFTMDEESFRQRHMAIINNRLLDEEQRLAAKYKELKVFDRRLSSIGKVVSPVENIMTEIWKNEPQDIDIQKYIENIIKKELSEEEPLETQVSYAMEMYNTLTEIENRIIEKYSSWLNINCLEDAENRDKLSTQIKDAETLNLLALTTNFITDLKNIRARYEDYIDVTISKIAPNVVSILGSKLAAKLLLRAGSIERLSTLPASTIQILGAENSFFRALRNGTKIPKHGLLFEHPLLRNASPNNRGKIARALATKIAIAVKIDAYSGELNKTLKEKLEERMKEIAGS